MHGFPSELDLNGLKGITLLQVCIGANEVILNFDSEVSITIESRFRVQSAGGHDMVFDTGPPSAAALVEFLSDSVSDAHGRDDGTLRLSFARGGALELNDSSEHFECYQIRVGPRVYVV